VWGGDQPDVLHRRAGDEQAAARRPKAEDSGREQPPAVCDRHAAFFAIVEIFLVMTPTFVWVYPWWGIPGIRPGVYSFFLALSTATIGNRANSSLYRLGFWCGCGYAALFAGV